MQSATGVSQRTMLRVFILFYSMTSQMILSLQLARHIRFANLLKRLGGSLAWILCGRAKVLKSAVLTERPGKPLSKSTRYISVRLKSNFCRATLQKRGRFLAGNRKEH